MGVLGIIHLPIARACMSGLMLIGLVACKVDPLNPLAPQSLVVAPQKIITYKIQNYCAAPGQTLSSLFVINASYRIMGGQIQVDSDSDGIPDRLDNNPTLGIGRFSADSNRNGFGDLVIFTLGLSVTAQATLTGYSTCDNPGLDSDGDGLSDCAETILTKTNPNSFDTDGDGIPDELELRFGLNPLDPTDAILSPAGDNMTAIQKVRAQLPIRESITSETAKYAHHYELVPISSSDPSQHCYDMTVSNIPIVTVPNGNLIISYIQDKPSADAIGSAAGAHRCCSVVPNSTTDGALMTVRWSSSPELICPCPLDLEVHG